MLHINHINFSLSLSLLGLLGFLPTLTQAISLPLPLPLPLPFRKPNLILSNDDGWAELNIREFFNALTAKPFGYNVLLSAPSENKSGTGSTDEPATVLNTTCEFDTCAIGSPAEGFNASDREYPHPHSYLQEKAFLMQFVSDSQV